MEMLQVQVNEVYNIIEPNTPKDSTLCMVKCFMTLKFLWREEGQQILDQSGVTSFL